MVKARKKVSPREQEFRTYAGLCGVLSRTCSVLGIPWTHEDGVHGTECQIKALDKWLTERQFGASKEESNDIEVPFG